MIKIGYFEPLGERFPNAPDLQGEDCFNINHLGHTYIFVFKYFIDFDSPYDLFLSDSLNSSGEGGWIF